MKSALIIFSVSVFFLSLTHCGGQKEGDASPDDPITATKKGTADSAPAQTADGAVNEQTAVSQPVNTTPSQTPISAIPTGPHASELLKADLITGVYTAFIDPNPSVWKGSWFREPKHPVKVFINHNGDDKFRKMIVRIESQDKPGQSLCTVYHNVYTEPNEYNESITYLTYFGSPVIFTGKIQNADKLHSVKLKENLQESPMHSLIIKQNMFEDAAGIVKINNEQAPAFSILDELCQS